MDGWAPGIRISAVLCCNSPSLLTAAIPQADRSIAACKGIGCFGRNGRVPTPLPRAPITHIGRALQIPRLNQVVTPAPYRLRRAAGLPGVSSDDDTRAGLCCAGRSCLLIPTFLPRYLLP